MPKPCVIKFYKKILAEKYIFPLIYISVILVAIILGTVFVPFNHSTLLMLLSLAGVIVCFVFLFLSIVWFDAKIKFNQKYCDEYQKLSK